MNRSVAIHEDVRPGFVAECAAVFVGGFAGALARYGLVELFGSYGGSWPWPIFLANIAGCVILGLVIAHRGTGLEVSLIGTGFCGALTTFSTFQLEIYQLLDAHQYFTATAYPFVSIFCGFLAVTSARRFVNRGKDLA
ncbi:MAG: CrcB family protein [Solirubrobacterales bacterium]|nr:CrcB family protein [Solirubrobacterales bacterium]